MIIETDEQLISQLISYSMFSRVGNADNQMLISRAVDSKVEIDVEVEVDSVPNRESHMASMTSCHVPSIKGNFDFSCLSLQFQLLLAILLSA